MSVSYVHLVAHPGMCFPVGLGEQVSRSRSGTEGSDAGLSNGGGAGGYSSDASGSEGVDGATSRLVARLRQQHDSFRGEMAARLQERNDAILALQI